MYITTNCIEYSILNGIEYIVTNCIEYKILNYIEYKATNCIEYRILNCNVENIEYYREHNITEQSIT